MILPEETKDDALIDVSLWRNMDQNENHQDHAIMILHCVIYAAQHLFGLGKVKVTDADLIAAAQKRHPGKSPLPHG